MNRRYFMMSSAAVTAAQAVRTNASPNDTVRVAVVGCGGRGASHMAAWTSLPNVQLAALVDVDDSHSERYIGQLQRRGKNPVPTFRDIRQVFDDRSVDAVSMATPNHWHALGTIWACQAGKDVYVEKPGAHSIWEGRKMVEAAHKYKRIVQHGVQLRSSEALQEAVQHLRKGVIGKVYMSRGLVYRWRPSIGKKQPSAVPAELNYDLWQGPAKETPYSERHVHYNWHWHWEWGNGDVGNQGIHETDMCMWGLGVDALPERVTSMGGKFLWDDDKETPEVQTSLYHYPDQNKMIQFEVRHWCTNDEHGASVGNIFYGSEGYLVVYNYDRYAVFLGQKKEPGPARKAGGDHFANFIKAVKSRKTSDQNGPVETAHLASALAHMGNISYRLGRQLTFDPKTEKFVGDAEANQMVKRNYRKPYVVPEKV